MTQCIGFLGVYACQTCSSGIGEQTTSPLLESPICDLCKNITKYLNEFAFTENAKKVIKSMIQLICGWIPGESQCEQILTSLYDYLDEQHKKCHPEKLCIYLHICPGAEKCELSETEPIRCDACIGIVEALVKLMEQPYFRKMIVSLMGEMCESVPEQHLKMMCTMFINERLEEWLTKVAQFLVPSALCQVIDLCRMPQKQMLFSPDPTDFCGICIRSVSQLKTFLGNEGAVAAVERAMDQICNLTLVYSSQCLEFTHNLLDGLVKDINTLKETEFCQKIHMCSG
ncbi:saposin [Clonorchis sinensis]|uniref:Saposin n=1 Tax=Clonorchis sinensis TaxID=79923 RepID=H2KUK0_CLOSI|nr:saposin [Clonorchis sinensis]